MFKCLTFLVFLASGAWLFFSPGWDSLIATGTSLAGFIASLRASGSQPHASQAQSVSDRGTGIQAGGNVTIGDFNKIKSSDDAK